MTREQAMTLTDPVVEARRIPGQIRLYDAAAFAAMNKAGQLTAQALDMMVDFVKPGVTTEAIDRRVFEFAMDNGAYPATLHYRGYTHSCCTSINDVVCHGIPNSKPLEEGTIINVDVTLIVDGWHGDSSRMYQVGDVKPFASRLIDVTYESLMRGLEVIREGAYLGDIGHAIQTYAESQRCSVVRDFCGHGLGRLFHDEPNVLHYGSKGQGPVLKAGMIFTVEPMINLGRPHVRIKSDGWTAVTKDRSLSAQFEHTIGVTSTGCEIFTLSPKGLNHPGRAKR
jgi:methionyl aminopeptidase